jgi:hypothetical protein
VTANYHSAWEAGTERDGMIDGERTVAHAAHFADALDVRTTSVESGNGYGRTLTPETRKTAPDLAPTTVRFDWSG